MRWTLWRQACSHAGRKRPQRTAKSCGPGAATLASSCVVRPTQRRWQKRPLTGESTKRSLKPLRGESRVVPAEPVVTTLVCFFQSAYEAAGAASARLSLRPLRFRGTTKLQNSGKSLPRECERVFARHCEERSDEAIHSSASREMDCFASLAMTTVSLFDSRAMVSDVRRATTPPPVPSASPCWHRAAA